tara:strand:- start:1879 stop:2451 length:573 start_codon:yes stop_codon:yes gene_type:complete
VFIEGSGENSGIEMRNLYASLNQDGRVGFSSEMKVLIPILIGLLVVGCGEKQTNNTDKGNDTPSKAAKKTAASQKISSAQIIPQAQPVFALLDAVKNSDQNQLKTVFSMKHQEEYENEGWDKVLARYQKAFTEVLGDYKPEDFTFEFKSIADEREDIVGKVSITRKGKESGELPDLRVIKENGVWKMAER